MLRCLLSILPVLAIASRLLQAQAFYGSIVGNVNDSSGGALSAATVSLTNVATGDRRSVVTASDGTYRFVNLVPGTYRLEIEQPGFKRYSRDRIDVSVESQVRTDIAMQVGDVSQSVEVQAEAPLLQTETANLSQVVGARAVQELPLNGRNILNLIALAPGVVPQGSSEGSLTGKNVFAAGNYQIGGGTANQSATYFDGVPVNDTYGNIVALTPSADAVSEFRIQTSLSGFNYGLRPNVVAGCDAVKSGAAQERLNQWFNTSCYTVPAAYTLGNEGRSDARVRGPGINNFNFALFKRTRINERFNLEFRSEVFNLFNRVQFGQPNRTAITSSTSTFGQITSQINDPRLIQLALRLRY